MAEGLIYVSLFLWLRDDWLRRFRFHSSLSPFSSLHRSSPPCVDPHGLLNLRKVLNALTSGQQWGIWMSWGLRSRDLSF